MFAHGARNSLHIMNKNSKKPIDNIRTQSIRDFFIEHIMQSPVCSTKMSKKRRQVKVT